MIRPITALTLLGLALACGGATPLDDGSGTEQPLLELPTLSGPKASPYASRLAEHLTKEEGVPCEAFGPQAELSIDDWTFTFDPPQLVEPENRLPWIKNMDERRDFSREGVQGLIVTFTRTNKTPVKRSDDIRLQLRLPDGSSSWCQPYNSELVNKRDNTEHPWDAPQSPPDQPIRSSCVYAVSPEALGDGAVMRLFRKETRRNDRGRKIEVLTHQMVVDLGAATPGASLRQQK